MKHEAEAAELFAAGKSVNAVAGALSIGWTAAKALKVAWQSETPGSVAHKPVSEVAVTKRGRPHDEEPEEWELSISVPTKQLDAMLCSFTPLEKANAVQFVIQGRMDAALGAS